MLSKEWKKAREAKGLTQEEVMDLWKALDIPTRIKKNLASGQYTRLDAADPRRPVPRLWPVTKYELARLLDLDLRDVDPEAFADYEATVELCASVGPTQRKRNTTCNSASPAQTRPTRRALSQAA